MHHHPVLCPGDYRESVLSIVQRAIEYYGHKINSAKMHCQIQLLLNESH